MAASLFSVSSSQKRSNLLWSLVCSSSEYMLPCPCVCVCVREKEKEREWCVVCVWCVCVGKISRELFMEGLEGE